MPNPYIVGDSSPFLKRVLIPFWVIRIIIMLVLIAIYGLILGVIAAYSRNDYRLEDDYGVSMAKGTVVAILVIVMILIIICLILDIVCIVKRARRTLSPRFFLIVNVIQTTLWVVFFILSVIGARTGLAIGIAVVILLSFLGLLIYASVVFHQFRSGKLGGGAYAPAFNPALPQQIPQPQQYAANTAYPNTEYSSPYGHEIPKPTYYSETPAPQPQQPQMGYGYELPTRTA